MIPMEKAQASMEYLLLLAAVVFFFAAMLPLFQQVNAISLFAADVSNARQFSEHLSLKANELDFLANGSAAFITAKPVEKWVISADGNNLYISVKSASLRKEKIFTVEFPNAVHFPRTMLEKETILFLRKEYGKVLLENS